MLEKLLAAGAYTIGDNVDYRRPADGYCVNLGKVSADFTVTIDPRAQDLVDELLNPRVAPQADPVEPPKPRKPRKPKAEAAETTEDLLDDLSLGSLAE